VLVAAPQHRGGYREQHQHVAEDHQPVAETTDPPT
jgi:hypothetical protein